MASGRPLDGEFAGYAKADIDLVPGDDAVKVLTGLAQETLALLGPLAERRVAGLTYEVGKWTLKEVLGHLADDERIFAYRALCLARNDARPLPGFDEKLYMEGAGFEARSLASLLTEYRAVRAASLALFSGLSPDAWLRRGVVNGYDATVRGLAFHIAGHECHHIRIVRERYLERR
ncbi:MAG: DinB family protein [Gemmatimonadales bacterium]